MKNRIGWRALARYLAEESPPEEKARIRDWAAESSEHTDLLAGASRTWQVAERGLDDVDVDAAWRSVARQAWRERSARGTTKEPRGARIPAWTWAAAAAVVIAVSVSLLQRFTADASTTIATATGEQTTVRMDDGSVARLAPNTRIRLAAEGRREVWLEGTAFFAVAENDSLPFVVHTPFGDARVLGTRFELRTEPDRVRLAVLEGRVALSGERGEEVVGAGEVSQVGSGIAPTPPRTDDVQELVGWMGNVLIFQNTPLGRAAEEIERAYDIRVHIADEALADRTLSIMFENERLDAVVATICRVIDARCDVQDTLVLVQP